MDIRLLHLGRAVAVIPASVGPLFHDKLLVELVHEERPSPENGWRKQRVVTPYKLYWYVDGPEKAFCAYSGYTEQIRQELVGRGFKVIDEYRTDPGLGTADLTKVAHVDWRPRQIEVFSKLVAMPGGTIVCPVGFGKTFLVKQLAKVYPHAKIGITVPSLDIARDMYKDLQHDLDDVGFHGTGLHKDGRVCVYVTKSLGYCPEDVQLLLVDEAHSVVTVENIKQLNRFNRAKFFAFTATPTGRGDNGDGFIEAVFGQTIAEIPYHEAVDLGNIVQLHVQMWRCKEGPEVSGIENKVKADRAGIWRNVHRNELIKQAAEAALFDIGPDAQILIMVDKVEHAYLLGQLLPDYAIVTGTVDPTTAAKFQATGVMIPGQEICTPKLRDERRQAFEQGTLRKAISTRIWRQGVDFRDLQILIRADGLSSTIDANQIPGRLSRLGRNINKDYGLLIDFYDMFSKNLEYRSKKRLAVYRQNKWKIDYVDPR